MEVFKTPRQREREQRDAAIYADYTAMMSQPGQSATEVNKRLMEKYNIASPSSIYVIRKRVEAKMSRGVTL